MSIIDLCEGREFDNVDQVLADKKLRELREALDQGVIERTFAIERLGLNARLEPAT